MKDSKLRWILYLIVVVTLSTIAIQVYWNHKNYLANKQQLINDVQVSLDKAVDDYYAQLAERTTVAFAYSNVPSNNIPKNGDSILFSTIAKLSIDNPSKTFKNLDSLTADQPINGITIYRGRKADSIMKDQNHNSLTPPNLSLETPTINLDEKDIKSLTTKVIISMSSDTLDLKVVDSFFTNELHRKKLDLTHNLKFTNANGDQRELDSSRVNKNHLETLSKSTFLPKKSTLKVYFSNETKILLKRTLGSIVISTLLVLAVIGSLFYLLTIIKRQKQLSELKNDLISNITHEFKTPIATIGVALESLKDFKALEDKDKTKNYLTISNTQLSKLNLMVEKLLETATLDSDELNLNKSSVDILNMLEVLAEKHRLNTSKTIEFSSGNASVFATVDAFHFENAINNLLDNAVKYGGQHINIQLIQDNDTFTIEISDNGQSLSKKYKDLIFEKFYRVPKGNTHDVKGFGIGLYYTKTIVGKHGGLIELALNKQTTFKVTLPND